MSDDIAGYQDKSVRYDGDMPPDHGQGLTANQRRRVALQELDEAKFSVRLVVSILLVSWSLSKVGPPGATPGAPPGTQYHLSFHLSPSTPLWRLWMHDWCYDECEACDRELRRMATWNGAVISENRYSIATNIPNSPPPPPISPLFSREPLYDR